MRMRNHGISMLIGNSERWARHEDCGSFAMVELGQVGSGMPVFAYVSIPTANGLAVAQQFVENGTINEEARREYEQQLNHAKAYKMRRAAALGVGGE